MRLTGHVVEGKRVIGGVGVGYRAAKERTAKGGGKKELWRRKSVANR
jgi:hypothetical protein